MSMCMTLPELSSTHYYFPDYRWDLRPLQRVGGWDYTHGKLTTHGDLPAHLLAAASFSAELVTPDGKQIVSVMWDPQKAAGEFQGFGRGRLPEIWGTVDHWLREIQSGIYDGRLLGGPPSLNVVEIFNPIFDNFAASVAKGVPVPWLFFYQEFSDSGLPFPLLLPIVRPASLPDAVCCNAGSRFHEMLAKKAEEEEDVIPPIFPILEEIVLKQSGSVRRPDQSANFNICPLWLTGFLFSPSLC